MSLGVVYAAALAGVWCLVRGEVTLSQVLLGGLFGMGFVVLSGAGRGKAVPLTSLPRRLFWLAVYVLVLVPYDIVRSNLLLARRIARGRPAIRPGIVRVSLGEEVPETVEALEEHAITMTPGQIVVDYSPSRRLTYVHAMDTRDVEGAQAGIWRWYRRALTEVFS